MEFQSKRKSKTLWFNIITLILLTIPIILTAIKTIEPGWGLIADAVGTLILGIGNMVIRVFWTDKPLDTVRNRARVANQSGKVLDTDPVREV